MWSRIALLAVGTLAIGTDGFIVAGVLQDIGRRLDVSVAAAGQLVTVFAVVYAISSPVLASLTANLPRRRLLLFALSVFIVGNAMAALAESYAMLMAGRVVAAIASAAYTPCASVSAAILAGPTHRGRALSVVMGGITVATIVGVPVGTWLGEAGGFRAAFWLVTGLGVAALIGLALQLPELPAPPTVTLGERVRSLRLPQVPGTLIVTTLAMTAGFTVYTYIGPLLAETMHAEGRTLSLVLCAFGIAGTIGNGLSGWLADRWGANRTVATSLIVVTGILAVFPSVATTLPGALFGVAVWNGAGWLLLPAQQHRLLSATPQVGQILVSLNASALYLGIGVAGLLGGWVIQLWPARALGPVAALVAALALVVHLLNARKVRRSAAVREQG
ncbi:Predicted arabinose efflux permease, MFS family [Methylobacterium sp. 174MFSha1.1]|uniref:MFS transporter n=1 Tax=Methylobacterium sp. 174MFSha1.1 TaxID=1502749 RepID=UPI0008E3A8A5|nr:MFS transporter [Methylobacterium sp. 174MFSha1.1]SFU54912.1 Predicted arabinose efflux permease, MFS family [Methylobacterium sp. 174MFSha1.1]